VNSSGPQLLHGLILTIKARRTMVCDSHGRIGVDDKSGVATGLVVSSAKRIFIASAEVALATCSSSSSVDG
jgi:hypothetical protein